MVEQLPVAKGPGQTGMTSPTAFPCSVGFSSYNLDRPGNDMINRQSGTIWFNELAFSPVINGIYGFLSCIALYLMVYIYFIKS